MTQESILESLEAVLKYLWASEAADFEASREGNQTGHIFNDLRILNDFLTAERQRDFIDVRWYAEDVLSLRPDLSERQAMEILEAVELSHDSSIGINLEQIGILADELFPRIEKHEQLIKTEGELIGRAKVVFAKLAGLIPDLESWLENGVSPEIVTLSSAGYLDLEVEFLEKDGDWSRISLGHYRVNERGEVVSDPSVVVELNRQRKTAATIRLESDGKVQWKALRDADSENTLSEQLNVFLEDWLDRISSLGFEPVREPLLTQ